MLGEHFVIQNVPPLLTAQSEGLLSELERRSSDGFECVDKALLPFAAQSTKVGCGSNTSLTALGEVKGQCRAADPREEPNAVIRSALIEILLHLVARQDHAFPVYMLLFYHEPTVFQEEGACNQTSLSRKPRRAIVFSPKFRRA